MSLIYPCDAAGSVNTASGFSALGVHFDGSTDLERQGVMTGEANSKSGMFSVWVKPGQTAVSQFLFSMWFPTFGTIVLVRMNTGMFFKVLDTTGGLSVDLETSSGVGAGGGIPSDDGAHDWVLGAPWRWFGCSWDVAIGRKQCYTSAFTNTGASDAWDGNSIANNTLQYVTTGASFSRNYTFGSSGGLNAPYIGDMAELYFITGTSLDLSNTTNLRKFISASGTPVDLGSTGSTPTGTTPLIYLKGGASAFPTNQAGKGDLTATNGTLTNSTTSP